MNDTAVLEPPTSAPRAVRVSLADLILLRLLPEKKSVAPKKLRADLAVFFRHALDAAHVDETVSTLRTDGFITPKSQRATDTGRARAMKVLGIDELPPKANWQMVKSKYLVPKALGLSPDATELADGKKLAAFLLKQRLQLPKRTGNTLNAVFEAIACRALGFPEHTTLQSLIPLLLAKEVRSETPISKNTAEKVVPRVILNTSRAGIDGLRESVLGSLVEGEAIELPPKPLPADVDEPFDLEMFANTVKAAARKCPTGRFAESKVFINHVWNQLRDEPRFAPLGLDGFKVKLVEANRANLLTLSRADLVQLMDPADVRASETTYLTATFHFILVEE